MKCQTPYVQINKGILILTVTKSPSQSIFDVKSFFQDYTFQSGALIQQLCGIHVHVFELLGKARYKIYALLFIKPDMTEVRLLCA